MMFGETNFFTNNILSTWYTQVTTADYFNAYQFNFHYPQHSIEKFNQNIFLTNLNT